MTHLKHELTRAAYELRVWLTRARSAENHFEHQFSESSPVFMGGSEILNPLLCFVRDQKFLILSCVHGGIRNSESSPVFCGGSEILNPILCSWGIRNSESSHPFSMGKTLETRNSEDHLASHAWFRH